jgi:ribosomal-protein-alanine N-acetyltransferase
VKNSDDNFQLRPMTSEDVEVFATWETSGRPYPWSRQTFQEALLHGCPTKVFVLDHGPAAVGFAAVHRAADEAYLSNMLIDSTRRRRGYGRELLERLLLWIRSTGATECFLDVDPSNTAALTLYSKFDFEVIERRPRSYPGGEDAVVMRKKI